MKALLASAAKYSAESPDSTADQISQAILAVFKDKQLQGVIDTFGTVTIPTVTPPAQVAPFAPGFVPPGVAPYVPVPTQQDVRTGPGEEQIFTRVPTTGTKEGQFAAIKKILNDPKNYTISGSENKLGFNFDSPTLNPKLLAGFGKDAIGQAIDFALKKGLKSSTIAILENAASGKPVIIEDFWGRGAGRRETFKLPDVNAPTADFAGDINSLYGASTLANYFSTVKPAKPGEFTTTQIEAIKGTARNPAIVQLLPDASDLKGIASVSGYTEKTATALDILAGLADSDGKGLKVIDASPRDSIPPVLIPSANASIFEREQIKIINQELEKAFAK
jgi:hypothetical protein